MRSTREWIVKQRSWLTPVLFLTGVGAMLWAFQFDPAPASELRYGTVDAHYVGPVDLQRGTGGVERKGGGIFHVGYGLGWRTGAPRFNGQDLSDETFAIFSRALSLTEEDVERVRAAGAPYHVGMHGAVIVTISGAKGSVISYEEYSARALGRRNQLLTIGSVILVFAAATFFVRSETPR